jgi:hypothetical protein
MSYQSHAVKLRVAKYVKGMTQNAGQVQITCLAVFSWSQEWERKAKTVSSRCSGIKFFIFSEEYTFCPVLSLNLSCGRWTPYLCFLHQAYSMRNMFPNLCFPYCIYGTQDVTLQEMNI